MKPRWLTLLTLAAALAWAAPSLRAQEHGHGNEHGNAHADHDRDNDQGKWEVRNGYEYRTYNPNQGTPPGWSKGKKTGWGNCGMPPGQAKKYGCRSYVYNGRTHYYYRDEQGRIFVRRPAKNEDHDRDHDHGHH